MQDRREFLTLVSAGTLAATFAGTIERALAVTPAVKTGTIEDVQHIVVLMQENRSFDHYFGTMRGVRGFGDRRPVKLENGSSVWAQPSEKGPVLPFRPDQKFGEKFVEDPAHGWNDGHLAWNGGQNDQWIKAKGPVAMTHYVREDVPFHFALADAFTVCDNYYCSLMGPTDPNRYHMWTGWCGNDGKNGGPVVDNAEAGYDWMTFPERLTKAGIAWKVYQDEGKGLDKDGAWGWTGDPYIGNYGDNSLLYFHQYQNAPQNSPLARSARTGTRITSGGSLFDIFEADVRSGKLPPVSYICSPEAYSEHPNWIPNYGAWYISKILDILASNPEVWSKTVLIINYDENGGFFDHIVPPTVPLTPEHGKSNVSIVNEIFPGSEKYAKSPYGFCTRVPMLAISPWSKGGWVNSQVFDHTSVIRFIEARFQKTHPGIHETNITPWRRAVAGDLTTVFDFSRADSKLPRLPSTAGYAPPDRTKRYPDYKPKVPAVQGMPKQETGVRPARALPYRLDADARIDPANGHVSLDFRNDSADVAAFFHVRTGGGVIHPRGHTVAAGSRLADVLTFESEAAFSVEAHGPNGFYRGISGVMSKSIPELAITARTWHAEGMIKLTLLNTGKTPVRARVFDAYRRRLTYVSVQPGKEQVLRHETEKNGRWYDLAVRVLGTKDLRYQFAGHIENGKPSVSDPAFGRA